MLSWDAMVADGCHMMSDDFTVHSSSHSAFVDVEMHESESESGIVCVCVCVCVCAQCTLFSAVRFVTVETCQSLHKLFSDSFVKNERSCECDGDAVWG